MIFIVPIMALLDEWRNTKEDCDLIMTNENYDGNWIVSGEMQERGVVLPFSPVVYKSLLSRLRAEGIMARETSKPLN